LDGDIRLIAQARFNLASGKKPQGDLVKGRWIQVVPVSRNKNRHRKTTTEFVNSKLKKKPSQAAFFNMLKTNQIT
jgi:hypothetical protein